MKYLSVIVSLLLSLTAFGQTLTHGKVSDQTSAPMERAWVLLVSPEGSVVESTLTNSSGSFVFTIPCPKCEPRAVQIGFILTSSIEKDGEWSIVLSVAPVTESVIMVATRGEAPTGQLASSVTVFDSNSIDRNGSRLVGDLLRLSPGTSVVQNGGRGNVTSLFVRGGENNYTKVLLDGITLNEPGGTFNFGGLSTNHVNRIEFVRGAQSALYGSDAMTGVLQMFSERGSGRPKFSGEFGAGSYGSWRSNASISGGSDTWDYSVHAGQTDTDNYAPNNKSDSRSLSVITGGKITDSLEVRLLGRFEDTLVGTPGQTSFGRPDKDAYFTQSHLLGGVSFIQRSSTSFTQSLSYSLATSEQRSTNLLEDDPFIPSFEGRVSPFEFYDFLYDVGSEFKRHQAGYQVNVGLSRQFLTSAFDWENESATLNDYGSGVRVNPSRTNWGATFQHQYLDRRFMLTSGLRYEHNGNFGNVLVPRFSAVFYLGSIKFKGNFGKGVKEPTIRQSFSTSPYDLGNKDLKAETSTSYDLGLEQRFLSDRVKVEIVGFDNRFKGQITTRTISYSPYREQYFNVGSTRARGIESVIESAPFEGLRLWGSYTFTDSEIIEATSQFNESLSAGNWALRRPRHSFQTQVLWKGNRADLGLTGIYSGKQNDSDFSALDPSITSSPGRWLWSVQSQFKVRRSASVYFHVDNLLNLSYMEPLGYPGWRRTFNVGVRIR